MFLVSGQSDSTVAEYLIAFGAERTLGGDDGVLIEIGNANLLMFLPEMIKICSMAFPDGQHSFTEETFYSNTGRLRRNCSCRELRKGRTGGRQDRKG